ncbi:MAG: hypothetical protein LH606_21785 [Cytophagaceae bacterium]|nr:hypothetical protein [Cytophagaceae bacterium]
MNTFFLVLSGLSALSALLPVGVAYFRVNQYDRLLRIVAVYVLVALGFDFAMHLILAYMRAPGFQKSYPDLKLSNLPLAHVWVLTATLLLGRVYEMAFAHSKRLQQLARFGTILVGICTVANTLPFKQWFDGLLNMPSKSLSIQSIFFLLLALVYFYRLFTSDRPVINLERTGMFWVNSAVLIYFSINFLAFFLWNYMIKEGDGGAMSNGIHITINIIANLLFAAGLLCDSPQSQLTKV